MNMMKMNKRSTRYFCRILFTKLVCCFHEAFLQKKKSLLADCCSQSDCKQKKQESKVHPEDLVFFALRKNWLRLCYAEQVFEYVYDHNNIPSTALVVCIFRSGEIYVYVQATLSFIHFLHKMLTERSNPSHVRGRIRANMQRKPTMLLLFLTCKNTVCLVLSSHLQSCCHYLTTWQLLWVTKVYAYFYLAFNQQNKVTIRICHHYLCLIAIFVDCKNLRKGFASNFLE